MEDIKMNRFPYSDVLYCLLAIAGIIVVAYYMAGWAFGAEKVEASAPTVQPGWIFCMNDYNMRHYATCRMFAWDGPPPMLSMPGEVIKK
jgi:hypothetical protein